MRPMPVLRLLTAAYLGFCSLGVIAQLPCKFSWDNVIVGENQRNFTTPASAQPYQGPCMAFAFNSAIEIMYRLEHDATTLPVSLNDAYIDYFVWDWSKTLPADSLSIIADGDCGNFPPGCINEEDCLMWGEVNPLILRGSCFEITREFVEYDSKGNPVFDWVYHANPTSSAGIDWFSVGQLEQGITFTSTNEIKSRIIDYGPLVLRVDGPAIENFRHYGPHNAAFHGYVVLGWKDVGEGTQWLLKDSWPGDAGFFYSKTDPGIQELIDANYVTAYQVSNISKNGQAGTSWPEFSFEAQCPLNPLNVSLNCWDFGADKGGCASVSGGKPPYSYQWQLTGTGGYLYQTGGNCVEIIGSQFNGMLTVTITDSLGQTAWDSCSFSGSGGGLGPN